MGRKFSLKRVWLPDCGSNFDSHQIRGSQMLVEYQSNRCQEACRLMDSVLVPTCIPRRCESRFELHPGSQTFWFEPSLPVVQRRIPSGLAQMPKLAAVATIFSSPLPGFLRNPTHESAGYEPAKSLRLRCVFWTSPLVHGSRNQSSASTINMANVRGKRHYAGKLISDGA